MEAHPQLRLDLQAQLRAHLERQLAAVGRGQVREPRPVPVERPQTARRRRRWLILRPARLA
jgi:hypothetical protein